MATCDGTGPRTVASCSRPPPRASSCTGRWAPRRTRAARCRAAAPRSSVRRPTDARTPRPTDTRRPTAGGQRAGRWRCGTPRGTPGPVSDSQVYIGGVSQSCIGGGGVHLRSRLLPAPPPLARPSMRIHVTIRTEAGTDGRTGAAQPPLSPQQLTNCLCMCMCWGWGGDTPPCGTRGSAALLGWPVRGIWGHDADGGAPHILMSS